MPLKIIYAGTPDFSVAALDALHHSEHTIVGVYTQPDRPSGRGKKITVSPVKDFAVKHGIAVFQPTTLKSEDSLAQLKALNADVMVVAAYGLILPKAVLTAFKFGCINIHASLLPRWRGAAPIQRAIAAGDDVSGVTIMQMDVGLDTGDILQTQSIPLKEDTTAATLHDELMLLGAQKIVSVLDQLEQGDIKAISQDEKLSTYAQKLSKAEGVIDWTLSAEIIERNIRAFFPWPGSTANKNGHSIKIHSAECKTGVSGKAGLILNHDQDGLLVACGDDALLIKELQIPGKKRILASELVHSQNWSGECFDEISQH